MMDYIGEIWLGSFVLYFVWDYYRKYMRKKRRLEERRYNHEPRGIYSAYLNAMDIERPEYPRYKHLIPDEPTEGAFLHAWLYLYDYHYDECQVTHFDHGRNAGIHVLKPDGSSVSDSGYLYHTEEPVTDDHFFYNGGCPWSIDDEGNRYYLIDRHTMLPQNWEYVLAHEIVNNYFNNLNKESIVPKKFGFKRTPPYPPRRVLWF